MPCAAVAHFPQVIFRCCPSDFEVSEACNTSYHHNFSVNNGVRTYYTGEHAIPAALQVGEHQFIERGVINVFIGLMLISWYVPSPLLSSIDLPVITRLSATNGARMYNTCLSKPENQPDGWGFSFELRMEHVSDAFFLLSLLGP
jgi:hypothetical protein